MLRKATFVTLAGAALVSAGAAVALPLGGPLYGTKESFDDYATGTGDANYNANWTVTPGKNRPAVGTQQPYNGANNLWIVTADYRISYNLIPDIQAIDASKDALNGTDASPLVQQFAMHSRNSDPNRQYASFFIELSKGDVMAPNDWAYSGAQLPVIAFGWTRGISSNKITPSYFDGQTWHDLVNTGQMAAWSILKTSIFTDTITIDNIKDALGSESLPRQYLGDFDTISLRSVANASKERSVDDIWLQNGVLTPEPASLSLFGLAGLVLLRRRVFQG